MDHMAWDLKLKHDYGSILFSPFYPFPKHRMESHYVEMTNLNRRIITPGICSQYVCHIINHRCFQRITCCLLGVKPRFTAVSLYQYWKTFISKSPWAPFTSIVELINIGNHKLSDVWYDMFDGLIVDIWEWLVISSHTLYWVYSLLLILKVST